MLIGQLIQQEKNKIQSARYFNDFYPNSYFSEHRQIVENII